MHTQTDTPPAPLKPSVKSNATIILVVPRFFDPRHTGVDLHHGREGLSNYDSPRTK